MADTDVIIQEESGRKRGLDDDQGPSPIKYSKASTTSKSTGQGPGSASGAAMLMPMLTAIAIKNSYPEVFTQRFRFSLPNCNWTVEVKGTAPNQLRYYQLPYYAFPFHRLPWYMNIAEYTTLKKNKRWAKIKECNVNMRYVNFRPYYKTASTETMVASNQNLPQFEIWRNFRHIMPYLLFLNDGNSTSSVGQYLTQTNDGQARNLEQRLYGQQIAQNGGIELGAVDAVRGYAIRPTFVMPVQSPPVDPINGKPEDFISGLNLLKHRHSLFNAQKIDTRWDWSYKPKNGLLYSAASAQPIFPFEYIDTGTPGNGANMLKTDRGTEILNLRANGATAPQPQEQSFLAAVNGDVDWQDARTFGRQYDGDIENSNYYNWGHKPNVDTAEDIFFGMGPQIQIDGSLMDGITEIEIDTMCVVECATGFPLSYSQQTNQGLEEMFQSKYNLQTNDEQLVVATRQNHYDSGYSRGGNKLFRADAGPPNLFLSNSKSKSKV